MDKKFQTWIRIVPVPLFIRELLTPKDNDLNIFSSKAIPHNPSIFSKLWSEYKDRSDTLNQNQTLYSFRHSGAIDIFKRTGSITKLPKGYGTLIYKCKFDLSCRLEVPELTEEDMPVI